LDFVHQTECKNAPEYWKLVLDIPCVT